MSIIAVIGIILALIVLFAIGWFVYKRFIRKSSNKPIDKDKDNPTPVESPQPSSSNESESTNSSIDEPDVDQKQKWEEFKHSRKANRAKINNDIVINENNLFDNPDISEIFSRPAETDKNLFKPDSIDSKVDLSVFRKVNYDSYINADEVDEIDINKLDDIEDFESSIKNIETAVVESAKNESPEPKIILVDNEVFGW